MKRLSEEVFPADSPASKLADLVKGAEPFRANPFRKRMILQRLSRGSADTRHWLRKPVLAFVVLGIVGSAGIAGASYGWYKNRVEAERAQLAATKSAQPSSAPVKALPQTPLSAPPEATPEPETSAPAPESLPMRRSERPVAARARTTKEDGEDPSEVLEAIRALRKQGDAARAQVLLNQYLKTHPSGALTEDALVLSIEAALARHDPRATEYAKRYLNRFPNGRFRSLAQRVLANQP